MVMSCRTSSDCFHAVRWSKATAGETRDADDEVDAAQEKHMTV
ncbi:hypothetical protein [Dactylosporangium sp. CA-233914]